MDYFDLHCDTALHLLDTGEMLEKATGHISLEKAEPIDRYAQVFALFVHDKFSGEATWQQYRKERACMHRQLLRNTDTTKLCTDAQELEEALLTGRRAVILSIENGAALGGQLSRVEEVARDGVRLLTLTWFRENELGYGSGCGSGHLKPFGYEVLKECRRVGIIPDISHLSDDGVADVFAADDGVLIATHSDARAVTNHYRNLTDEMIAELIRREGLIGLNFAKDFLHTPGENASLDDIYRHIYYFLERGCEKTLCFGSDFDGAHLPSGIDSIASIPPLFTYLQKRGLPDNVLYDIFFENALHFFRAALGGTKQNEVLQHTR